MSTLTDILDGMAEALNDVMGPTALGENAVQVWPRMNLEPQAPTSVDMYPADPFRGEESTGFGERAGELIFTVRARVTTQDIGTAQDQLLHLLDDEHELSLAAALEADPTLDGLVSQLHVDGDTGYRIFDDPPGAMLGVAWRVRVINLPSEVPRVSTQKIIVRGPFEFAFDTPGLADGVAFYTPAVNDILLEAWIETDTAFDGTTPRADIGMFVGTNEGYFNSNTLIDFPLDLTFANAETAGAGLIVATTTTFKNVPLSAENGQEMFLPARFTAATPLKLVVSQDGLKGGTPIDSTQGAARLYITTATPVAFA